MKKNILRTFFILGFVIIIAAFSNRSGRAFLHKKHTQHISFIQHNNGSSNILKFPFFQFFE